MPQTSSQGSGHDIIRVESSVVSCDGRKTADDLGHPLVYLNMGDEDQVSCPYCSRVFMLVEIV
ncbi:MAG: zinc-finger domain-containing protein [Alphaproteobacteria bacterium]|nr:zinc-finger domain-containing protein [Alphaproteobacteria bacterium]